MTGDVKISFEGPVGLVQLHNPPRRNAINRSMWAEIAAFANSVSSLEAIRVIVFSGEGSLAFSAGADVADFTQGRSGVAGAADYDNLVEETCRAVEAIPQPTIALVKGACMGAGASLAASCDLRVASVDAFFAVPAAKLGLGYDPRGIDRLCRVFGRNLTTLALLSAQKIPAARAHHLGAVHILGASEEVDGFASDLAKAIASNAPLTIKAAKFAIRSSVEGDAKLRAEADRLYQVADASADYVEGRSAFMEKRPAKFLGK